jgi:hypothetical protein
VDEKKKEGFGLDWINRKSSGDCFKEEEIKCGVLFQLFI